MKDEWTPRFLTMESVLWLHRQSLEKFGGLDGVRDSGAISAALGAAQNTYFYANGDQFEIAATYAFHIAEAQAFLDGNKRTAVACALTFLGAATPDQNELYDAMIANARREMNKTQPAAVLRRQFSKA